MTQIKNDNYESENNGGPDGCSAMQVGDGLFAGTDQFRIDEEAMHSTLNMGKEMDIGKEGKIKFSGITFIKDGADIVAHQRDYVELENRQVQTQEGNHHGSHIG